MRVHGRLPEGWGGVPVTGARGAHVCSQTRRETVDCVSPCAVTCRFCLRVCVWSYIFLNLELSAHDVVHPEHFIIQTPSQSITTADTQTFKFPQMPQCLTVFKARMPMSHLAFDFPPTFCEIGNTPIFFLSSDCVKWPGQQS